MKPVTFLVKHAVATAVLVGGATALAAVVYFALLAWAILTNGGLGGPFALPGMIVAAFLIALASSAVLLFPATAAAELLRSRSLRSRFVEIPISSFILLGSIAAAIFVASVERGWSTEASVRGGLVLAAAELVFLGVYWWVLQAAALFLDVASRLWSAIRTRLAAAKERATKREVPG